MREFRDYRLIVELGMDPEVVDRTAAARLDWLLLIHDEVLKARAAKKPEDPRGAGIRTL